MFISDISMDFRRQQTLLTGTVYTSTFTCLQLVAAAATLEESLHLVEHQWDIHWWLGGRFGPLPGLP